MGPLGWVVIIIILVVGTHAITKLVLEHKRIVSEDRISDLEERLENIEGRQDTSTIYLDEEDYERKDWT